MAGFGWRLCSVYLGEHVRRQGTVARHFCWHTPRLGWGELWASCLPRRRRGALRCSPWGRAAELAARPLGAPLKQPQQVRCGSVLCTPTPCLRFSAAQHKPPARPTPTLTLGRWLADWGLFKAQHAGRLVFLCIKKASTALFESVGSYFIYSVGASANASASASSFGFGFGFPSLSAPTM
jgi:hypothetical protein